MSKPIPQTDRRVREIHEIVERTLPCLCENWTPILSGHHIECPANYRAGVTAAVSVFLADQGLKTQVETVDTQACVAVEIEGRKDKRS